MRAAIFNSGLTCLQPAHRYVTRLFPRFLLQVDILSERASRALNSHHIMLQRNLLYTAITRARRLVVLVSDPKAIAVAVRNDKVLQRYTALAARVRQSACGQDATGF